MTQDLVLNRLRLTAVVSAVIFSCAVAMCRPVIGFLTDYGQQNEAVGLCKGAMARINPDALVIDLTHNVDSYNIRQAALVLRRTNVFPRGSVFVCVVDPGVGTARRGIAVKTGAGFYFVGPDNGMFSAVLREQGIEAVVELDSVKINVDWKAGTFDGRDLFSPAGAMLATSGSLVQVGHVIDPATLVTISIPTAQWDSKTGTLTGEYMRTDEPYGNVWTNITADELTSAGIHTGEQLQVTIGSKELLLPYETSFGHVAEGKPLAYLNSDGTLALALNMGDFRKTYGVEPGTSVTLRRAK